jgi:multisubunit Na+/H+ antiporter MnhG subunit
LTLNTFKVLLSATLTSSFAVCLFPPFYPRLAEEKGNSASVYGFVIGTNCLTSFLVTPVIGKKVSDVPSRSQLLI